MSAWLGGAPSHDAIPAQVTLSEGRDHTAKFKDADRLYHLKRESDLVALRREIEKRMVASVQSGDVVSSTPLALDLRGPGLQPMVLVDLPGIIQVRGGGRFDQTGRREAWLRVEGEVAGC